MLTVNEEEARVVRRIFDLYANRQMGIRRISRTLYDEGVTSRQGNAFNVLTIRHILSNPKYKGWYCAGKSQTVDYRSRRKVFLDESEWVMYPDPSIPAIVSEELWDRANALYRRRSQQMLAHKSAADFHNRYPYSGKIICEEHGTSFHRQVLKSARGEREVWQCRVYRDRGRAACSAPQVETAELDRIVSRLFGRVVEDREAVVEAVLDILRSLPGEQDRGRDARRVEEELGAVRAKKDRLLELSIQGAVTTAEFRQRNDGFNRQARALEERLGQLRAEEERERQTHGRLEEIRTALERELDFERGVDSALASAILDRIVVKKDSTKAELHLELYPKSGGPWRAVFNRAEDSFCFTPF